MRITLSISYQDLQKSSTSLANIVCQKKQKMFRVVINDTTTSLNHSLIGKYYLCEVIEYYI